MNHLKKIIFIAVVFASGSSFSQEILRFCPDSATGWNKDDCIASCSQLRVDGSGYVQDQSGEGGSLPNNEVGFCFGKATFLQYNIHRIALGTSTGIMCNVFSGYMTLDLGRSTPGTTIKRSALNYSDCPAGTYDRIFITTDRLTRFAAETSFPDGSGRSAKTTSDYATDSISSNVTDLSWIEEMSGGTYSSSGANSSKNYSRPSTSWNTVFKKVSSSPNTSGVSSQAAINTFDEWAAIYLNSLRRSNGNFVANSVPNTDGDFYCETGETGEDKVICIKLDADTSKVVWRMKNSSTEPNLVGGLPVTLESNKKVPLVTFSYHSAGRGSDSEEYGARFHFKRSGSNAIFLGTNVSENGLYISITQGN